MFNSASAFNQTIFCDGIYWRSLSDGLLSQTSFPNTGITADDFTCGGKLRNININSAVTDWITGGTTYTYPYGSDIKTWDTSIVTDMDSMFQSKNTFNSDISDWDVSRVTNMQHMFESNTAFNTDISNWDVSRVETMYGMFRSNNAFNTDISNWDVSRVTTMMEMFSSNSAFNADISKWQVSQVVSMQEMFDSNTAFNTDISNWNVKSVTTMNNMFNGADAFAQTLCGVNWVFSTATKEEIFPGSQAGKIASVPCSCNVGQVLYNEKCKDCVPGKYQDDITAVTNCKDCIAPQYSYVAAETCTAECILGTTKGHNEKCIPCEAGKFGDAINQCKACTGTKYSSAGQKDCDFTQWTCPTGTYPSTTSKACLGCPAGFYSVVTATSVDDCTGQCPIGTYSDETGLNSKSQCKVCPPGTYTDKKNTSSCTLCPAGRYNYVKPDDIEYELARSHNSVDDCLVCDQNSYTNEKGWASRSCTPCPPQSFIRSTRNTDDQHDEEDDCLPADAPDPCTGGSGRIDNGQCEACIPGKFATSDRCVFCPTGYFNKETGQTNCEKCNTVGACIVPGATSKNTFAAVPLEHSLVFENVGSNNTRGGTKVLGENEPLDQTFEIPEAVTTPLYMTLAVIVLLNLALHRFCPTAFKNADVLFAGDHFIDDSVRAQVLALFRCRPFLLISACTNNAFSLLLHLFSGSTRNECWTLVWEHL